MTKFPFREATGQDQITTRDSAADCAAFKRAMNEYLASTCGEKAHDMKPENAAGHDGCACSGGGDPARSGVDLIVLVDGSSSMGGAWSAIGQAATGAVDAAVAKCGTKARVTYLFVDPADGSTYSGALGSTVFTKSHEAYLRGLGYSGTFATEGESPLKFASEQGPEAIVDLCRHFDWREGACRSLLYVSDEVLSTINFRTPFASLAAANSAIAAAQTARVTLFTHFLGNGNVPFTDPNRPSYQNHYTMLAAQTGGAAQIDTTLTTPTMTLYTTLISQAICKGCGAAKCATLPAPDAHPCISIRWGDSDCDCMEGDDHEALCLTVSNCYSNVTFSNVRIGYVIVVDVSGSLAPRLPDGSPSSWIYPTGPICFGDIGPCVDGKPGSVSRDAVIINRGLPPGKWFVRIGMVCFDATFHYAIAEEAFEFDVCKN